MQGTALVKDGANGTLLTRLGPGQHFGERALMGGDVRAADVVAETRLVVYKLCSEHFAELLGSVDEIWRFEALQKVNLATPLYITHIGLNYYKNRRN